MCLTIPSQGVWKSLVALIDLCWDEKYSDEATDCFEDLKFLFKEVKY